MKSDRQNAIIDLIEKYDIETQEDMISRLRALGYEVTQATVSRDIRELKLTKLLTYGGSYKYVKNKTNHHVGNIKLNHAVVDSITKVDYSANVVVLKTYPGLANAVAVGIDSMSLQEILGSVAGDDTIIVVTRDEGCAKALEERFCKLTGSV